MGVANGPQFKTQVTHAPTRAPPPIQIPTSRRKFMNENGLPVYLQYGAEPGSER